MHLRNFISILFFLLANFLNAQTDLTEINFHGTNPGNLKMFVHVPKNSNDSIKRKPLVVVLHGCSENAEIISKQSGWNKLADEYGFYVLYAQQNLVNNPEGCFDWFNKKDVLKDKGEVFSIKEMIDFTIDTFAIDTTKIFAYGLSAGAAMAVALLADYPALFNTGAILAGGAYMSATDPLDAMVSMAAPEKKSSKELAKPVLKQNPDYKGKYPDIIIMHGKNDPVVNIKNSYQLVQQWTFLHHTDTIPDFTTKTFENHSDITKYIYTDSTKNAVVIFYEINNLGHTLMVDPGDGKEQGGETGMFAADKDFFSTYWIAVDFGLIEATSLH